MTTPKLSCQAGTEGVRNPRPFGTTFFFCGGGGGERGEDIYPVYIYILLLFKRPVGEIYVDQCGSKGFCTIFIYFSYKNFLSGDGWKSRQSMQCYIVTYFKFTNMGTSEGTLQLYDPGHEAAGRKKGLCTYFLDFNVLSTA